jgi:hypothetical protein
VTAAAVVGPIAFADKSPTGTKGGAVVSKPAPTPPSGPAPTSPQNVFQAAAAADVEKLVQTGTITAAQAELVDSEVFSGQVDTVTLQSEGLSAAQVQAVSEAISGAKQAAAAAANGTPGPPKQPDERSAHRTHRAHRTSRSDRTH